MFANSVTRRSRRTIVFAVFAVLLTFLWVPKLGLTDASAAGGTLGGFELEGNLAPDTALDWGSPAATVGTQPVTDDLFVPAEADNFTGTQEDDAVSTWKTSTTAGAGGKDDIGDVYKFWHK